MNLSTGTLHAIGSEQALNKHQERLIQHAVRILDHSADYGFEDDFRAIRVTPNYLRMTFRAREGHISEQLAGVNDVLFAEGSEPSLADDVRRLDEIGVTSGIRFLPPGQPARIALVPHAPLAYTTNPKFACIIPIIRYVNADARTGRYKQGEIPIVELSHLVADEYMFRALIRLTGEELSPYTADLWVSERLHLCVMSLNNRWKMSPETASLVSSSTEAIAATLSHVPGMKLTRALSAIDNVVPRVYARPVSQPIPREDRIVMLLTWTDEGRQHLYRQAFLAVPAQTPDGEVYQPPVTVQTFVETLIAFNGCIAGWQHDPEIAGYPHEIDVSGCLARIAAEREAASGKGEIEQQQGNRT